MQSSSLAITPFTVLRPRARRAPRRPRAAQLLVSVRHDGQKDLDIRAIAAAALLLVP